MKPELSNLSRSAGVSSSAAALVEWAKREAREYRERGVYSANLEHLINAYAPVEFSSAFFAGMGEAPCIPPNGELSEGGRGGAAASCEVKKIQI